jgi:hypothetical protein
MQPLRLIVAVVIALKALDDLFATALTLAYRADALGMAERLGRLTPGDDYRRLIPLMEAVPAWLHGLWVLAGILYLLAVAGAVLGRRGAHFCVLAALGVEVIAMLAGRPVLAETGVVVNPNPSVFAAVIFPYVLPLLSALVLWRTDPERAARRVHRRKR